VFPKTPSKTSEDAEELVNMQQKLIKIPQDFIALIFVNDQTTTTKRFFLVLCNVTCRNVARTSCNANALPSYKGASAVKALHEHGGPRENNVTTL